MKLETVKSFCSVCNEWHSYKMLADEALMPHTLDFCIVEPAAEYLLQECPRCEYVARDVSEPLGLALSVLERRAYYSGDVGYRNEKEKRFIRYALLCKARADHQNASWAYLYAAKVTEDDYPYKSRINDRAYCYRKKALQELEQISFIGMEREAMERTQLIILDTLRRLGRFAEASEYAGNLDILSEEYSAYLTFQKKLIQIEDSQAHFVKEKASLLQRLQPITREESSVAARNKKTPKKKEPPKKKIIRDRARESKMEKLFALWERGDREAYEQLLQIAREDDKELTAADLVHPYDTDKFVARKYLHIRNIQQRPCDCIIHPGLSLEDLKIWKEIFLEEYAFYPPVEYLALLHFCNGCSHNGKEILGFGKELHHLNVMKYELVSYSPIKSPALHIATRLSFDECVYYYTYLPIERLYASFFEDHSDFHYFDDSVEIYASLWEVLNYMKREADG